MKRLFLTFFISFFGKASKKTNFKKTPTSTVSKANLEGNPKSTEGIVSKKKSLEEKPTSTEGIVIYLLIKCT